MPTEGSCGGVETMREEAENCFWDALADQLVYGRGSRMAAREWQQHKRPKRSRSESDILPVYLAQLREMLESMPVGDLKQLCERGAAAISLAQK